MRREVIGIHYENNMKRINAALSYEHSSGGTSIYTFSKSKKFGSQHKTAARRLPSQVDLCVLYI